MFQGSLNVNDMVQKLKTDLKTIFRTEGWLVVVTGDVFGDGTDYEMETVFYQQVLGELNGYLASMADLVIEAVCGIKLVHKGKELLINEGII
jgi:adenosylcobinamide kinase/adenosylcobinamide-phosphate guanylyltransferase